MIDYPQLTPQAQSREMIDVFGGYNANLVIGSGEFSDMENLTADCYPVMSVRKPRGVILDIEKVPGHEGKLTGVAATDRWGLIYTCGKHLHLHGLGKAIDLGLNEEPKRFVFFGTSVIIFPDKKYVDMENPVSWYGDIDHKTEVTEGTVKLELCTADAELYGERTVSNTPPTNPVNGSLWVDTSANPHVLKRFSEQSEKWVDVVSTFVKISGLNYGTDGGWFSQYDGLTISGIAKAPHLNGSAVHYGKSSVTVIIPGILDQDLTQDCATEGAICVQRKSPDMDFVVAAGNRLWGCRFSYGEQGAVNEIYASKLGDFKNWNCFMGLSTDSWVGSVGAGGEFTGGANVGGNPVFYKADCKLEVHISPSGAHQVTHIPCQGVALGCDASVATLDGVAIYKTRTGFCVDDGSMPVEIGQCFAGKAYSSAVGCTHGRKYYVSMVDENQNAHLFAYDWDKRLWHREDSFAATSLFGGGLLLAAEGQRIWDMTSGTERDSMEKQVRWMAQTGDIGLSSPDAKYISRLTLRLYMEAGAELTAFAQYDMEEEWVALFSIQGTGLRSFSVPVRPRRCDHLRLRLEGVGDVKIYSITKTIEEGSELP